VRARTEHLDGLGDIGVRHGANRLRQAMDKAG